MKQITIVYQNGVLHVSGVKDNGDIIEPELTESLQTLILQLIETLDGIKTPEEELQEQIKDYLKETAPDEALLNFMELFDPWQIGKEYTDEMFVYEGYLYRVIQPITAMKHQPPSLLPAHYKIIEAPGVIGPWRQPLGEHDAYQTGDKVTHNDQTWVSTADNNVWEPGVYGWEITT